MEPSHINSLLDLNILRTAPSLDKDQSKNLLNELRPQMDRADWFTIGIMAPSETLAILTLQQLENRFNWPQTTIKTRPNKKGSVFLKANQSTGDVHIRLENGLGEGILLSCQHNDQKENAETFGPFPLDFFQNIIQ